MEKKPDKIKVACVQINAGLSWESTWNRIKETHLPTALSHGAKIIALPEMFLMRSSAEALNNFPQEAVLEVVSETKLFCKKNRVSVLLGSLPEKNSKNPAKIFNTSILVSEKGNIVTKYQKIHLFDVGISKKCTVSESKNTSSGSLVKAGAIQGLKAGLSVCYDLRFPELYRVFSKKKCEIVFVPANFTYLTGKVHWEILLRARAIENQMFIIAPNQSGSNQFNGLRSYGTSMIVSPWGNVLAKSKVSGEDVIVAELDLKYQRQLRKNFPVLKHRKIA